jgi:hypothetical protein
MRPTYTRTAAALTAVAAGGFAIYALRPSDNPATQVAAKTPAVAYRTQVIRRTIHVVKHEHGGRFPVPRGAVATGGRGPNGSHGGGVRTSASGHHSSGGRSAGVSSSGAVATRTSGSHSVVSSGAPVSSGGIPVATRTSGSHVSSGGSSGGSTGGSSHPVTRTSGGGSAGGSGGSGHPVTRTSGGGGHHDDGHDGGDGGGD